MPGGGPSCKPVPDAVAAVTSRACRCGRHKHLGSVLCGICWRGVPRIVQHAIYVHGGIDADALAEAFLVLDFRARQKRVAKAAGKEENAQDYRETRETARGGSTGCR